MCIETTIYTYHNPVLGSALHCIRPILEPASSTHCCKPSLRGRSLFQSRSGVELMAGRWGCRGLVRLTASHCSFSPSSVLFLFLFSSLCPHCRWISECSVLSQRIANTYLADLHSCLGSRAEKEDAWQTWTIICLKRMYPVANMSPRRRRISRFSHTP